MIGERTTRGMSGVRPQIYVELFGLPGAGKTTIARVLHRRISEVDPTAVYGPQVTMDHKHGLPRTAGRGLLIIRQFPWRRSDWQTLHTMATMRQQTLRDRLKVMFSYLTVASLHGRLASRSFAAVIDQGPLQAIWSAHLRSTEHFSPEKWRPLLRSESQTAKLYVFVDTPVSICRQRLSARCGRHSRMQSPGLLGDMERWQRSARVCVQLMDSLRAYVESGSARGRVMIVDGTQNPDDVADGVLARLLHNGVELDAGGSPDRVRQPPDPPRFTAPAS
jgi:hypothetical protein